MITPFKNPSTARLYLFFALTISALLTAYNYYSLDKSWRDLSNKAKFAQDLTSHKQLLRDALKEAQKFGKMDDRALLSLGSLARFQYNQGEYVKAQKLYEELLARMKKKYGDSNLRTVATMDHLAKAYYDDAKHQWNEFVEYKTISQISRNLPIEYEDPEISSANEKLRKAITLLNRSLKIKSQKLGFKQMAVAKNYLELGAAYDVSLELEKAEQAYEKSLSIYDSILMPDDPKLAEPVSALLVLYERETEGFNLNNNQVKIDKLRKRLDKLVDIVFYGKIFVNDRGSKEKSSGSAGSGSARIEKKTMRLYTDFRYNVVELNYPVVSGLKPSVRKNVQENLGLKSIFEDKETLLEGLATNIDYEIQNNQNNILSLVFRIRYDNARHGAVRMEPKYLSFDLTTGDSISKR